MDAIRRRLERDLSLAMARLRQQSGAVAIEELPRSIGGHDGSADEVDTIHASEQREIGFATRELLVGRVKRLSAALDRLSHGRYGTCVECDEPISVARLHALPEVEACVRCQDRLERGARPVEREPMELQAERA